MRYFVRMTSRATPFGLFAGCSLGTIGSETAIELAGVEHYQRHTRLDGNFLWTLTEQLRKDPTLRRTLVYEPNNSLYQVAGAWRYVGTRIEDETRKYYLMGTASSAHLDSTLERARNGASWSSLVSALVDDEVTEAEADEFVERLADAQILVTQLAPQVTGAKSLDELIAQLRRDPATAPAAVVLEETRTAQRALDAHRSGFRRGATPPWPTV